MKVGVDLIEIERIERALERYAGFRGALLHGRRARVLRQPRANPAQHYAARFAGKEAVGKALGCGVPLHLARDRDRRPAEAGREALRADEGLGREGARGGDRPLDVALEGARDGGLPRRRPGCVEPLYTAAEMRTAEEAYPEPSTS